MNTLQTLYTYENVIKSIRIFFDQKKFHEVTTPILHTQLPLEPTVYPLTTSWQKCRTNKKLYLTTSPESSLKILLAEGIGNCYAIGKSFRDLEDGGMLNLPEFLMLEWYRENADYRMIMDDVKNLILWTKSSLDKFLEKKPSSKLFYDKKLIDLEAKWQMCSFVDLFEKYLQLDFFQLLSDRIIFEKAKKKGYTIEKDTTWEQLFNQLFLNEIYSHLPKEPFFLIDFPSRISPLCRTKKGNPQIAERFEFFLGGIEIANGNTENTDSEKVKNSFNKEQKYRIRQKKAFSSLDKKFISSLKKMSKKPYTYAGVGLGVERLIMVLTSKSDIKDVVLQQVI